MVPRAILMKTGIRSLNTARPVNTTHPKTRVYSARPMVNSAIVNAVRANQGHLQKEDQGYVDSECSRHMTRNMSYLSDFKEFDEGYMCDKKNSVLFTDTGCFVLSSDFKLADESQATLDESMLWHRRLGYVNFKTINKLVKENLVRGLPIKHFENDQTCVACLKGKQHKASCIKKEFSVSRIPQQNGVAERRNRTLIEADRTMVLVVKPHNKTPYELFRGRTPALSFMRPFGCHVTILNTLDYLGKFDGKSNEGFFVGYSMNSKAFRVYNIRTRKVEENLHIMFLDDKPIIAGDGPKWLFDIDVLTKSMNYVPVVADGSLFDSSSKNASNDEPQPSSDAGKKDDEGVNKESGIDDQKRPENSTQYVYTTGPSINTASTNVNTGSLNINIVSPTVTTTPLEATHVDFFGDETEVDMSNISTTYPIPSTPNTIIHKDHSLDHVISDVHSGVQTRRTTKTTNEQGFISAVYEGKTHEDLHTCLFAYFLSQVEPKKVIQALTDPSWIEAMQDELLQASNAMKNDGIQLGKDGKPLHNPKGGPIKPILKTGKVTVAGESIIASKFGPMQQGSFFVETSLSTSNEPSTPGSMADLFKSNQQRNKKIIKVSHITTFEEINGADVAIPKVAVGEVREHFSNTLYGYFIVKEEVTSIPVWVKLHKVPIMAYSEVGLSYITSKLGKPIMLDSYTCDMCLNPWGRSSYARALIEMEPSDRKHFVESLVVGIPLEDGFGHSMETIEVEYEWKPPHCGVCKTFGHTLCTCPKRTTETTNSGNKNTTKLDSKSVNTADEEGFVEVSNRKKKGKNHGKFTRIDGIKFTKPKASFYQEKRDQNPWQISPKHLLLVVFPLPVSKATKVPSTPFPKSARPECINESDTDEDDIESSNVLFVILMPLWKDGSLFDSFLKNDSNDEPQPFSDAGKKDDEGVSQENGIDDQERPENSTQDVNTDGPSINTASTNITTGSLNINTVSPIVTTARSNGSQTEPDMFSLGDNAILEAAHVDFFGDETKVDIRNITTTYPVPSTPNTRIHKDHSLDHVIGDVQSGVQTRRMTKTSNEQGFISAVYEGKTHEDLHTYLFACFLSQVEPKKVIQDLTDPSWIEAMQDELLQFKL
ncbi:putative ribonuclease H-like domain-containing protein [Tanacetum coccineum]